MGVGEKRSKTMDRTIERWGTDWGLRLIVIEFPTGRDLDGCECVYMCGWEARMDGRKGAGGSREARQGVIMGGKGWKVGGGQWKNGVGETGTQVVGWATKHGTVVIREGEMR